MLLDCGFVSRKHLVVCVCDNYVQILAARAACLAVQSFAAFPVNL